MELETLFSRDWVTQGDPLSMVLYRLSLSALVEHIRTYFSVFIQSWYYDDFNTVGAGANILPGISHIE